MSYLRYIPNVLTMFRLFLVVPVVFSIARGHYQTALLIFMLAGFTDGLDGFLARRYSWQSELGSLLDPLADKFMMVAAFMSLALREQIPLWLLVMVMLRDLIIVAGVLVYHLKTRSIQMYPTLVGKVNTLLQVLLIVIVLFNGGVYPVPDMMMSMVILALLISTVLSCIGYVFLGIEKVNEDNHAN